VCAGRWLGSRVSTEPRRPTPQTWTVRYDGPVDVSRYLDKEGRILFLPMKKGKALRGPLLDLLVEGIPSGVTLTEGEVNEAIKGKIATLDHAYFRRVLVETGRLERTPYGDAYWRPGTLTPG